jgi:iron(III) transport system substrate-binding protein
MNFMAWAAGVAIASLISVGASADVNVYSARQEALIKPQLDAFTQATGIKVNLVTGDGGELMQRLKAEGAASPADLLFTVDVANLHRAKAEGLFQKLDSPVIREAAPAHLRDSDDMWVGLGVRARPIFYVDGKVNPAEIPTYESLADPKFKGRILVRSSTHPYNQSLLASIIAHDGAAKAEAWAAGVGANLARKPQGGDRDQISAAAAGLGDIVIVNTYYHAMMMTSSKPAEREAAMKLRVHWPNQNDRGAHVNVSGAGLTAASKNRAQAIRLLEFLLSPEAQKIYAEAGFEYPVRPGVALSPALSEMGGFKMDTLALTELGRNNAEAVRIFDRTGWR